MQTFAATIPEPALAAIGRVVVCAGHARNAFELLFLSKVIMQRRGIGTMEDERVNLATLPFDQKLLMLDMTTGGTIRGLLTELQIAQDKLARLTSSPVAPLIENSAPGAMKLRTDAISVPHLGLDPRVGWEPALQTMGEWELGDLSTLEDDFNRIAWALSPLNEKVKSA